MRQVFADMCGFLFHASCSGAPAWNRLLCHWTGIVYRAPLGSWLKSAALQRFAKSRDALQDALRHSRMRWHGLALARGQSEQSCRVTSQSPICLERLILEDQPKRTRKEYTETEATPEVQSKTLLFVTGALQPCFCSWCRTSAIACPYSGERRSGSFAKSLQTDERHQGLYSNTLFSKV